MPPAPAFDVAAYAPHRKKASTDLKRLFEAPHTTHRELAGELPGALPYWEDKLTALDWIRQVLAGVPTTSETLDGAALPNPCFHHGDLTIRGNVRVEGALVVTGDLHVQGIVSDGDHRSTVLVGGDCHMDTLYTSGDVLVAGDLDVDRLIYAVFNDHVLAAETIRCPLLISDDHAVEAELEVEHDCDLGGDFVDAMETLTTLLVPALIVESEDEEGVMVVDRHALFERLYAGEPILR